MDNNFKLSCTTTLECNPLGTGSTLSFFLFMFMLIYLLYMNTYIHIYIYVLLSCKSSKIFLTNQRFFFPSRFFFPTDVLSLSLAFFYSQRMRIWWGKHVDVFLISPSRSSDRFHPLSPSSTSARFLGAKLINARPQEIYACGLQINVDSDVTIQRVPPCFRIFCFFETPSR